MFGIENDGLVILAYLGVGIGNLLVTMYGMREIDEETERMIMNTLL